MSILTHEHDIAAVMHDRGAPRRAQGDVKYGAVLRVSSVIRFFE
jgi:hypothetical protein